jgi:hypothetical protein
LGLSTPSAISPRWLKFTGADVHIPRDLLAGELRCASRG